MIEAVLFDAGNTLVELDYEEVARILGAGGFERDPATLRGAADGMRPLVDAFVRESLRSTEQRETLEFFLRGFLDRLGIPAGGGRDAITRRLGTGFADLWVRPTEGSWRTLLALRERGYRLAVVSNSDGSVARQAPAWPAAPLIETVVDSGVEGVEKPDPEIFRIALRRLGVEPRAAVHVGDLPSVDVAGARAAGIAAVLLDPADLFPGAGVRRIRRLPDLLALLPPAAGGPAEAR